MRDRLWTIRPICYSHNKALVQYVNAQAFEPWSAVIVGRLALQGQSFRKVSLNAWMLALFSVWHLTAAGNFLFRVWDDDDSCVVYNALSGDTHLVSSMVVRVVELLETSPQSTESIACEVAACVVDTDQEQIQAYVEATMVQLEELGLAVQTTN